MGIDSLYNVLTPNVMMQLLVMCDDISISQNAHQCHGNGDPSMSDDDIKRKLKSHALQDDDGYDMSGDIGDTFQSMSERSSSLNPSHYKAEKEGFLKKNMRMKSDEISPTTNRETDNHTLVSSHEQFSSDSGAEDTLSDAEVVDSSVTRQNLSVPSGHLMTPKSPTDNLPVDVGDGEGFSKALEKLSLPLLYLPTTKQLIAGGSDGTLDQKAPNSDSVGEYCEQKSPNPRSESLLSSHVFLNPSQPDLHKVPSSEEFPSSSYSNFPDTDRLTLHNSDSFPSILFDTNLLNSDNRSLSSVSTGTNFSVSNLSIGDDVESRSFPHAITDETLFMDINLDARNSFDTSRPSTLLNGKLHDQNIPLSQTVKKKPLSGFK